MTTAFNRYLASEIAYMEEQRRFVAKDIEFKENILESNKERLVQMDLHIENIRSKINEVLVSKEPINLEELE